MPSVVEVKSSKFADEILKSFIDKIKATGNDENIIELWENELKSEAKRTFTLLPLEAFELSVFKELELLTSLSKSGGEGEIAKQHKSKSFSRGSLRKSLSGSGSSFANKMQSISFVDSQIELYNKVKNIIKYTYLRYYNCSLY